MNQFIRSHLRHWDAYIPGEQPQQVYQTPPEHSIIKLNTNESPFNLTELHDHLKTQSNLHQPHFNRYPDPTAAALRTIASTVLSVPRDQLVFANGSDELISAIFRAYLDPSDQVTLPVPTYGAYAIYSGLYNIPTEPIALGKDFLLDPQALATTRGKVLFLPNPHAPSGAALSRTALRSIIAMYPQKLFIVDEAYADFHDSTLISEVAHHPNLIILRTLSKAFSLAGLRVGYAVSHPEHSTILRKVLDPYNLNTLAQDLAALAFTHHKKIASHVKTIIATRETFTRNLSALGFHTIPSKTNFVLTSPHHFTLAEHWLKKFALPYSDFKSLTSAERAQALYTLLTHHHILVRYFPTPELSEYLRITIGTASDMERLTATLHSFQTSP